MKNTSLVFCEFIWYITQPSSEGPIYLQLLNRRYAEHEAFDAGGAEVHGDYRIAALVLCVGDLAETVLVVADHVAHGEVGDIQAIVLGELRARHGRAGRIGFRCGTTRGDFAATGATI